MLKAPTVWRNVNVLLDQVPNRGRHRQGHQFGTPVLEEELLHSIKASYLAPAKYRPRCLLIDRFRAAAVRIGASQTVPV